MKGRDGMKRGGGWERGWQGGSAHRGTFVGKLFQRERKRSSKIKFVSRVVYTHKLVAEAQQIAGTMNNRQACRIFASVGQYFSSDV